MAFKLVVLAALVAAASAGYVAPAAYAGPLAYAEPGYVHPLAYTSPIAKTIVKTVDSNYDPNPQYSYSYDVQDAVTGDNKQQQETRNGDVVQGSYSLVEADGGRRVVDYTADPVHGFNAVVRKEGGVAAALTKAATPIAYTTPVAKYGLPIAKPYPYASPYAYSPYGAAYAKYASPLAYSTYGAPLAKYAAPVAYSPYGVPVAKYGSPLAYSPYATPLTYPAPAYYH